MVEPLRILHRGFDGLDVSFEAVLPPAALEGLRGAKEQAAKEMRPVAVKIGPGGFDIDIAETGARGGYKFMGDTGLMGETWFIKDRPKPEPGNIRVSAKSLPLVLFGYDGVKSRVAGKLAAMGAMVVRESVGRVDFAVDFLMPPDFELRPDQFVTHARATVADHPETPDTSEFADGQVVRVWSGRRALSVTIGKQPGRQVIVYDKRREVIAKGKLYWFKFWDVDRDDKSARVWRVEVRLGKQYLYEVARIRSYDELARNLRVHLLDCLEAVRYLESPHPAGNISRQSDHPLWGSVREQIRSAFDFEPATVTEEELTDFERGRIVDRRWKMIEGLIPGVLAAEGYSVEEAAQTAPSLMADCAERFASRDAPRFANKYLKASQRLRFLGQSLRTTKGSHHR